MTRGALPKAYLRLDPNIDQTHPDGLADFVRLLCAANRQPSRGRFRSRGVLDALLGKSAVTKMLMRQDIAELEDGSITVPGWAMWQEGDVTVGERMRRYRDRHTGVTEGVTKDVTKVLPTSEAVRRQGSKAVRHQGAPNGAPRAAEDETTAEPEAEALDWLRAHKCLIREGDGFHQRLIHATERHGAPAIVLEFERLAKAGTQDGDLKGFLFVGVDRLDKAGRPNLTALEEQDRQAERDADWQRRVDATKRRQDELRGVSA